MPKRFIWYACAAALLWGLFWQVRYRIDRNVVDKTDDAALAAVHATVGKTLRERALIKKVTRESPKLAAFIQNVKAASPHAIVDSSHSAVVTITDTTPAKKVSETVVCDEYDRFCLESTASGNSILRRNQKIKFLAVFARSADNKIRIADMDVQEFKPGTEEMIPTEGLNATYDFSFTHEEAGAPSMFHPRLLVGIDHRTAVGVGIELLNFEKTKTPVLEKVTVSLNGYYDRKAKEGRLVVQPAYRLFNSNVAIGPYVGINHTGNFVIGAAASIELTR